VGEDITKMFYAGHRCASCVKKLYLTDAVAQLEVVYPAPTIAGTITGYAIESDDGGFAYEPHHFHLECWEKLQEEVYTDGQDTPPVYDPMRQKYVECIFCSSDIRMWETSGMVSFGEIHRSQRCPNEQTATHFELMDQDKVFICLPCLWTINKERLDMWNGLTHVGECEEGRHLRCWRFGIGSCGNICNRT